MENLTEFAWIGWVALILIFVIVEILTVDLIFLMLAVGSLGGLVSGAFGTPWWAQLLIAAVIAMLLLFTLRPPLLRALKRGGDPARSNVDALIGMHGRVVSTVGDSAHSDVLRAHPGQVKLDIGETWTAKTLAPQLLSPGADVIVLAIEGATAIVAPQSSVSTSPGVTDAPQTL